MNAQTNYPSEWKAVEKLISNRSYSDAYTRCEKLLANAKQEHNSREMLNATLYLSQVGSLFKENSDDSVLTRLQQLLPQLDAPEQALCHLMMAKFYDDYHIRNRWVIRRNSETDEMQLDYKLWPDSRFNQAIREQLQLALNSQEFLQQASVKDYPQLLTDIGMGPATQNLFDVVVDFCTNLNDLPHINQTDHSIHTDQLFGDLRGFALVQLPAGNDTWRVLSLMQQQARWALAHDNPADATLTEHMIILDIQRLNFLADVISAPCADIQLNGLERIISFYQPRQGNQEATHFFYRGAQIWYDRDSLCQAMEWCVRGTDWTDKGEGYAFCVNLKHDIENPSIQIKSSSLITPNVPQLASAVSRNIPTLYLRIVKDDNIDKIRYDQRPRHLLHQKVLHAWSQPTAQSACYQEDRTALYLPALPAGKYILIASDGPDFKENSIAYSQVECDPVVWSYQFSIGQCEDSQCDITCDGLLLDRRTGQAMPNQWVTLKAKSRNNSTTHTCLTDAQGRFHFESVPGSHQAWQYEYQFSTTIDGYTSTLTDNFGAYFSNEISSDLSIFLNKPIYRLGEQVDYACILSNDYDAQHEGSVVEGRKIFVTVFNPNSSEIHSDTLTTDRFGRCHGSLTLPTDAMNGTYSLICLDKVSQKSSTLPIRVEAYKQPKFFVSLPATQGEAPQFGQEMPIEGMAQSYNGVPLDGATLTYNIQRQRQLPWWRIWYKPLNNRETVADGSATVKPDGTFSIDFTPQPDTTDDLSQEPYYLYTVRIDVTDISGESHSATRCFRIGYCNSYVNILSQDGEQWDNIRFNYCNLDDQPLPGRLQVKVEQLTLPNRPALTPTQLHTDLYQSLTEPEFIKRYPTTAYHSDDNDPEHWIVQRTLIDKRYEADGEGVCTLPFISKVGSGVYRVTVTADGRSYSKVITITTPNERQCQSTQLLWTSFNSRTLEVGEALKVRIGSRFKGVNAHYMLSKGDSVLLSGMLPIESTIETLTIPITADLRGGVKFSLCAILDNQTFNQDFSIEVPFSSQKLEIETVTFRDKIQPGAEEYWSFRVKRQGTPVEAAMLATLYDDALTHYAQLRWSLNPEHYIGNRRSFQLFRFGTVYSLSCFEPPHLQYQEWDIYPYQFKSLVDNFDYFGRRRPMLRKGTNAKELVLSMADEEELYVMEEESVGEVFSANNSQSTARGESGMASMKAAQMMPSASVESLYEAVASTTVEESVMMRTNLNTAAFFLPQLTTDVDSGCVEISFTAPELLSRWNLHLLTWTPDMAVGSRQLQTLTQKELMVQPNLPRFLRQGDNVVISCKVSNLGESDRQVTVSLELSDAQSDKVIFTQSQPLTVAAGRNGVVDFSFQVPSQLYVAQYKVIARSQGVSDGEQALLPVLTNRQLVTESLSMYLNGKEQKHYTFEHLQQVTSSTLEHHNLKLEFCSNPMWYAIQSIPYLATQESPSMIYLANLLYVDHLGRQLLDNNPQIEEMLQQWSQQEPEALTSKLELNADIKQTLLDETPWLQQAHGESEQMRQLADFFQRDKIDQILTQTEQKLLAGQHACGGWGWMPESREADLWTTERILLKMGELQHRGVKLSREMQKALDKALSWTDKEEQRIYTKYIKGNHCFDATDILYLYTRSFYDRNAAPECYRYYYSNALKNFNEYENLYTRAQLALIFQRHGDHRTALLMAKALKQCALYSDEMGMYWRDNVGSYWWYRRPIETQAMLIEMINEVQHDEVAVAQMQQWLLKQRQTTCWSSDIATTQAITALMVGADTSTLANGAAAPVQITLGNTPVIAQPQSGTGYMTQQWSPEEITPTLGDITLTKSTKGIAWGALYWQYFEDMDKIPASEMGISLQKVLYRYQSDGTLQRIADNTPVQVGDRLKVRILIRCDRHLEFLELRDQRGAGLEPVSTRSGWNWNDGLSYYVDIHDASSRFFINRMEKGEYVLEYDLWANNAGIYTLGSATMQCMYAPEFRSNTPGATLTIQPKKK